MARHITLLCGAAEGEAFSEFLHGQNAALQIEQAPSLSHLEAIVSRRCGATRLLAFMTDVIVPARVLRQLSVTPYNIHPGPPEYPGAHPNSFAILEEAATYGVTAHQMIARVDAGPIVAVSRFAMPSLVDRLALADRAYGEAVTLFAIVGAYCAQTDAPMPALAETWTGRLRTRAEFAALCRPAAGVAAHDLARLRRACGADLAIARAA